MKMKKLLLMLTVGILVIGTMAMSFADAAFGPAAIYASLTNMTEQEAYDLKVASGKTFGELAKDANVYDAFVAASLTAKTDYVNSLVASGDLTQEEADAIITAFENCDGTQTHILRNYLQTPQDGTGLRQGQFGNRRTMSGDGTCVGTGVGTGTGFGRGMGRGNR
jgi:hypothetical protein